MTESGTRRRIFDRDTVLLSVASVLGVAMLVAGWLIQGVDYLPSLLQQFGSTLVMLVPLLYLGRVLEGRIRRAEEHARRISENLAGVRSDIQALGATAKNDLDRHRRRRDEAFAAADREPTQSNVLRALREGALVGAVSELGIRVPVSTRGLRIRVSPPDSPQEDVDLPVVLETVDGSQLVQLSWRRGANAEQLTRSVARELTGSLPGGRETVRDTGAIMRDLVGAIRVATLARTGESPVDLGNVVEIPNEQWVVCTDGIRCRTRSYFIPAARLLDARQNWTRHMATRIWVDPDQFAEAYRIAAELLAGRTAPAAD